MPEIRPACYGHVHLSLFFRKTVEVREHNFIYKQAVYPWNAIDRIDVWQEPWPGLGRGVAKLLPRARIYIHKGPSNLLRGDALRKQSALSNGFQTAFYKLVALFQEKRRFFLNTSSPTQK